MISHTVNTHIDMFNDIEDGPPPAYEKVADLLQEAYTADPEATEKALLAAFKKHASATLVRQAADLRQISMDTKRIFETVSLNLHRIDKVIGGDKPFRPVWDEIMAVGDHISCAFDDQR